MNNDKIKVVIADDNTSIRKAIRYFLEKAPNVTIIGEASNGQEAITLIENLSPDILILDIHMPVMDGLTTIKLLKQKGSKIAVIILSGEDDFDTVAESMNCGAHSYILKEDAPINILTAVNKACHGESGNVSLRIGKNDKYL